jgi:hypothetical protein
VKQLIPAGPYTLGGIAGVQIAGVQHTPDLIWRDNDGSLNIMVPDPEYPEERRRVAQVNTIGFTPKRGAGHKMTEADDPSQMALARLFCASGTLFEHRSEIVTGLNMMVNNATNDHSRTEWKRVRDAVYDALTSVTGDKPADSVSHHRLSLAEATGAAEQE